MITRKNVAVVAALLITVTAAVWALAEPLQKGAAEPSVPPEIRTALQDRRYDDAVRRLDNLIRAEAEGEDYWLYLKGLAQFYAGQYEGAVTALGRLEREHADSKWLRKARFTMAEAHLAGREYEDAEEIYEAEAQRLMAEARKDELAGVLVSFADKLAAPRDETKPDSPEPDYQRAHKLYTAALDFEISPALRDEVMFKLAETMVAAEDWQRALSDLQAYLREFDPDWAQTRAGIARPGGHVCQARFDLGVCFQKLGRQEEARRTWQDLVAKAARRIEHLKRALVRADVYPPGGDLSAIEKLRADAMYRIGGTYRIGDRAQTLLAVKALRDFLAEYAAAEHAVRAAFDVGAHYEAIQQHDDAVAAYRQFLAGKGFRAESEEAKEALTELAMEAKFRLGGVCLAQKKYDDATAIWNDYIANHPAGPHWSRCQQGIIEAEYRVGADLRVRKEYDAAREAWQAFLKKYPLDRRARQIMYDFGQMSFQAADDMEDEKPDVEAARNDLYTQAVRAWERLVSKYPNTDESSHGQFMIGQVYEMKLRELPEAVEEYRKCTWGSYAPQAAQRIRQMTERQLTVLTERTWRGGEPARLKVQMRNIEKLTVNLYRLDLEDYFRKMHRITGVEELDTQLIDADKTWEVEAEGYAKYKPIEQEVEIPTEASGPGIFAVRVTGGLLQATTLVIRSDLDIVVKCSKKALLVFAEDMADEKPWPDVRIIASDGQKVFFEGQTGSDGVLYKTFEELESADSVSVLAVCDGHVASNALGIGELRLSEGLSPRGYIYTDRPAYRPGQKVHIRAILRETAEGSYAFEVGQEYVLEVVDSQGRVLATERLALNDFGTLHHEFTLGEFAPTGKYTMRCRRPDGPTFSGTFEVQRYKLEKMQLVFELPHRIVFRGEPLEGKLIASYYYGEPVADREVEYFMPDGRRRVATTDPDGEVPFTFDTTPMQEEQALVLRAGIVGENVRAQATAFLAIRAYSASVSVLRDVSLAGEPFEVTVRASDVEQKPVGRELMLKVLKRESVPDGTWAEVLVLEERVVTGEKTGAGSASVALEKGGQYILRAEGTDRFSNPITAQTQVFVSDDEDAVKLRILADRQRFKVGETPTVTVHSRLAPALTLLTFEGEEIISYRVVKLARGKNPVEIHVGNEHFPNFALGASAMVGNKFYTATQSFLVERELKVVIKPDRDSYEPGDEAAFEIMTTDQNGHPVAAELSLAMVDESLFGIFPDRLTAIRDFFEKGVRRVAALATTTSCTFSYHPPTVPVPEAIISEGERLEREELVAERRELIVKEAAELARAKRATVLAATSRAEPALERGRGRAAVGDIGGGRGFAVDRLVVAEELAFRLGVPTGAPAPPAPPPREAFPETAYWNPTVVTDDQGKATVTVQMPDSMTKWRLTARGATPETLVGQQTASVATKKDFFVELKLPAIVTEGDSIRVTARVHNLTNYKGPAVLRLQITAGEGKAALQAKLELDGRGITEHVFDGWKVPEAEELAVRIDCQAAENADALSRDIPVRPWGIEFADSRSGLVDDRVTFELALPADRTYTRQAMQIRIDTGLQQRLIDVALGPGPIIRALAGCRLVPSQAAAASELVGVTSVMQYVQDLGRAESPDYKRLSERAEGLIATLLVTQHAGGGWPWAGSKDQTPDPYTSSRAVWALGKARSVGLAVPEDVLAKGVAYLKQAYSQAQSQDNELKAAILHALAVVGEADFGYAYRLYRLRQGLSPAALAHTVIALSLLDRDPMAAEVLDVLETKREPLRDDLTGQSRWPAEANQAWMRSDDEMTALALLAYLHVRPDALAAKEAVEYLLAHQPWTPARARGPALAGLARWFGKEQPTESNYRLTIRVNEQDVKILTVRGPGISQSVEVPAELVKSGKNRVDLLLTGRGRPHYVALLTGFSGDLTLPVARPARFGVRYRYYKAAVPEYKGKPVPVGFGVVHAPFTSWINKVSQLPVGAVSNVEVSISRDDAYRLSESTHYLVVHEHLPAGTSVLEDSIRGNFDYYRLGDGEITFYVGRHVPYRLHYSLVGYAPGSYRVLPTVVQSVYSQGKMRLGRPDHIEVLDRGQESKDPYDATPDELYYLGKAYFDDGLYAEAEPLLAKLFNGPQRNLRDEPYRETARMLLFINIERRDLIYCARYIVRYFEAIKEKYPDLVIPFDKVLAVGLAYGYLGEYERAIFVFKATIAASFVKDAHVAGVLQQQGEVLGSVDFMRDLWQSYPDTPTVMGAYLALSDTLYALAPKAHQVKELKEKKITHDDVMLEAIRILVQYLMLYPEDPTADDAALNLVNAYLKLEDFSSTVKLCRALRERFLKSPFLDSFEYVEALALWNLGEYEEATSLAIKVAEATYPLPDGTEKPSDNKDLALYIVGQIWHARGRPEEAIEYYGKVKDKFADAAEAMEYFEHKDIRLDEVSTFEPGQDATVTIKYRNIPEVHLLVYRVDLMTLYLTEKNLSRITKVKLAGIHPALEPLTERLGDGKDYAEKEKTVSLKVRDSGAYLVICRGGDLHASGMVLVTPLKLEVQEDRVSGRVRVNVMDRESGDYLKAVHVKVIGSDNRDFVSGETDLRGIFVADDIRGTATVIARDEEGQFAFYRGEQYLGVPIQERAARRRAPAAQPVGYLSNVQAGNAMLQMRRLGEQRALYDTMQKGVQVEQMMQQ